MRNVYRIVRFLLVSLLSLTAGIPILLYLLLSIGPVHRLLQRTATEQLTELLGADVSIGSLRVLPFSRVELSGVSVALEKDTVMRIDALNAGVSMRNLLFQRRIVVTDMELMGADARIWRSSPGAPLNIQPIIDRLKGDGSKPPSKFNLAIHTVVIRAMKARYDVRSVPFREGFDPDHLAISDLRADITAPKVSSEKIIVNIRRLNFAERSGASLRNLSAAIEYVPDTLRVKGLDIRMEQSQLKFADTEIAFSSERIAFIELLSGSRLSGADFRAFVPALAELPAPLSISARAELFRDSLSLHSLTLDMPSVLTADASAGVSARAAHIPGLKLSASAPAVASLAAAFRPLSAPAVGLLNALGQVDFEGTASWKHPKTLSVNGSLTCDPGTVDVEAELADGRLCGSIDVPGLDLGAFLPGRRLGQTVLAADFELARGTGYASMAVDRLEWRGHTFSDITAQADYKGHEYVAHFAVNDSLFTLDVNASADLTPGDMELRAEASLRNVPTALAGVKGKYADYAVSADVSADFRGETPLRPTGTLKIAGLGLTSADGARLLHLEPIILSADLGGALQSLNLSSDFLLVRAEGNINLATVGSAGRNLLARALPQYFTPVTVDSLRPNDFILRATVRETSPLFAFMNLPVTPIYPVIINGSLSERANSADLDISAPYLRQGNKLISRTRLTASVGDESTLGVTTTMPSKYGPSTVRLNGSLTGGSGALAARWEVDGRQDYSADLGLTVRPLDRGADIRFQAGKLVINGENWDMAPAFAAVRNGVAMINNLTIERPGQEAVIRGTVSKSPDDRLTVCLDNIDLDYVFSALQLGPAITFGGNATGTVTGSALLSGAPVLETNDLSVRNFSYSGCVMGDAAIRSRWNNDSRAIEIHANIPGHVAGGVTVVDGSIAPMDKLLDFNFHATHTPLGFLSPLMSAFASGVDGTASGNLRLFGDFHNVDLEGDALAENFAITIAATGVTYFAGDTIRIRPGVIDIPGVTVRDASGHTALFSGVLRHDYFRDCRFSFRASDARDLLVYDMPPDDESRWYGRIRGNGSVDITGRPGYVKIAAAMSTAPGSEFTFSLSDRENAAEYNFLTFRDVTQREPVDSIASAPGSPELDRMMQARVAKAQEQLAAASNYDFDFQIDVTPDARMQLIMDPTAGDKITAYGSGHVGVLYGSGNDEMRMYGDYRIARGDYNFSLQDIILKNFTLREGSEVSFHGDPMDANLDISAVYQLNANLSDLDESFLTDKEVQRTSVPVYAVLNVDGSIQDPVISFDLDFPTLTSEVKRKVRSIVSTEEMMNRQIIYLLALNRFYTPDYMTGTKGNELMSVASGTISSQLSNILGQLSDKISVAPSVRSSTGDFSDMEFDVALSSTLLNNRLLLNGNFGYRDRAMNTSNNQFIGDFDVEYLLTRAGNWRLKAYNHFNDRNLYLKSALTTQGLGIVFKHDFDTLFRRKRR